MKRNLLLFLILLIGLPAFSQNWAPINTTEKFCYSSDDSLDIINNVIWVDSIQDMGDHDIYYFNKIVAPCDTCSDTLSMLLNQPQFLLDHAKVYNSGDWIFESENQHFLIKTQAGQDEEWTFDSDNNISASVTGFATWEVLGETDYWKVISLSNGESFALSQNHGLVNWMSGAYRLVGIEGRDLGTIVPTFRNMYRNWSAGDVICYHRHESFSDGENSHDNYYLKYTIQEVTSYEDSIIMEVSYLQKREYWLDYGGGIEYEQGEEVLFFYPDILTEAYPNEIIRDPLSFPYSQNGLYEAGQDTMIMVLGHHEWGGVKKMALEKFDPTMGEFNLYTRGESDNILVPVNWENSLTANYYNHPEYAADFTFYESELYGFEWYYSHQLIGFIDDGDTTGTIYEDDILLGSQQLVNSSSWLVYPNPADDLIRLHSSQKGNIICQIYNDSGVLVDEQNFHKTEEEVSISLTGLSSGVYLMKIIQNEKTEVLKFLKQ
jgi:hypothetical protein